MTCSIAINEGYLTVDDPLGNLTGKHYSQLCYWGFRYDAKGHVFTRDVPEAHDTLGKVLGYFSREEISFSLSEDVKAILAKTQLAETELARAIEEGALLKAGKARSVEAADFVRFASTKCLRPLKKHQLKAALHLIGVRNGANFSVPGSGKTAVVLAVFHWLRGRGEVDSLFVVGPPSCFAPWQAEYQLLIGATPTCEILAGGNVEERRSKYYASKEGLPDLYLTTYQTLQRDWDRVKLLFNQKGVRFFFVADEAHYIKKADGLWANAVLNVANCATIRCILTGTPFPQSYADAFNLFDLLWPECSPIGRSEKIKVEQFIQKKKNPEAAQLLDKCIGPLFYRVRKSDLGLAPQHFLPPILVSMKKYERYVYDSILNKIRLLSREDYFRDIDLLLRLRRGRMMRLRQCLSYARLLSSAMPEYDENLLEEKDSLAETIRRYDEFESPAKLEALVALVGQLRKQREKIVIWSNFVETLKLICNRLRALGHGSALIYGATPTENSSVQEEMTREKIIAEFVCHSSKIDILVANPAACSESISLHKECSHAIYYDLSYNCAQYLQSLDRIHRVGGSEDKIANYHFLQYANTIEGDILTNVLKKTRNMSAVIDQDYPIYSLDMFSDDDELRAYERLFK
jgi:SNF2 family DNA or RNA helicase